MMGGKLTWRAWLPVASLFVACLACAQDELANLPDPTRPIISWGGRAASNTSRLRLESTIVSGERRLATINGKTLAVGARINGARIRDITPYKVELDDNGRLVTLKLVKGNLTRHHEREEVAQ